MNNKRNVLLIIILIVIAFIIRNVLILNRYYNTYHEAIKESGVDESKIIKKYNYEESIDMIGAGNDKVYLYLIDIKYSKGEKKYKVVPASTNSHSVSYAKASVNDSEDKLKKSLKYDLSRKKLFRGIPIKRINRVPIFGLSMDENIYNLKINDKRITDIIEYKHGNEIYYIWYFKDLNLEGDIEEFKIEF